MYLGDHILHLLLHLILRPQTPLPQLIPHAPPRQQRAQRLLPAADRNDAVDVFGGAAQQGGAQDRVRDLEWFFGFRRGLVQVQEGEVDVALEVGREPGFEGGGFC